MIKGYQSKRKPKLIHHLVKKGYTKAHQANSKKAKFKDAKNPVRFNHGMKPQQPQLEEADNNFQVEEQEK